MPDGLRLTQLSEYISNANKSDLMYIVTEQVLNGLHVSRSFKITVNNLALGIRYNSDVAPIFNRSESVYTTVKNTSGSWVSTYTTVKNTSGSWVSTYTTVKANSAAWDKAAVDGINACNFINTILIDMVFPIGGVITNNCCETPANWMCCLGSTTWSRYGRGKVFVGEGEGIDNCGCNRTFLISHNTLNCGEYRHKLSEFELPSHTHVVTDHGHCHKYIDPTQGGGEGARGDDSHDRCQARKFPGSTPDFYTSYECGNITLNSTGGNLSHENMPPYMVVYSWIRTS